MGTPDTKAKGLDPVVLFDVILGTPETLEELEQYLLSWPSPSHRHVSALIAPWSISDASKTNVHQRLADRPHWGALVAAAAVR